MSAKYVIGELAGEAPTVANSHLELCKFSCIYGLKADSCRAWMDAEWRYGKVTAHRMHIVACRDTLGCALGADHGECMKAMMAESAAYGIMGAAASSKLADASSSYSAPAHPSAASTPVSPPPKAALAAPPAIRRRVRVPGSVKLAEALSEEAERFPLAGNPSYHARWCDASDHADCANIHCEAFRAVHSSPDPGDAITELYRDKGYDADEDVIGEGAAAAQDADNAVAVDSFVRKLDAAVLEQQPILPQAPLIVQEPPSKVAKLADAKAEVRAAHEKLQTLMDEYRAAYPVTYPPGTAVLLSSKRGAKVGAIEVASKSLHAALDKAQAIDHAIATDAAIAKSAWLPPPFFPSTQPELHGAIAAQQRRDEVVAAGIDKAAAAADKAAIAKSAAQPPPPEVLAQPAPKFTIIKGGAGMSNAEAVAYAKSAAAASSTSFFSDVVGAAAHLASIAAPGEKKGGGIVNGGYAAFEGGPKVAPKKKRVSRELANLTTKSWGAQQLAVYERMTNKELLEDISQLANGMISRGCTPTDTPRLRELDNYLVKQRGVSRATIEAAIEGYAISDKPKRFKRSE